ncbi:putative quinol monooxygenase [Pseudomonadales bacterium]|nr:antibiotic biosynthesis monooxygenase [Pseudomonadales bacterium]MDC1018341.1 putative quinol monooxygenase [Pseudomonadales bacterium]
MTSPHPSASNTIYNNVVLTVNSPTDISTVAEKLAELATDSLQEPGCERFEVYHSNTDPALFMLIERWASQQALDQHRDGAAFQQIYLPNVIPLVSRSPHLCQILTQ